MMKKKQEMHIEDYVASWKIKLEFYVAEMLINTIKN